MADTDDGAAARMQPLLGEDARWHPLLAHVSDAIIVFGVDGRVSFATPSNRRLVGAYKGSTVADALRLVHPEDRDRVAAAISDLAGQPAATREFRYRLRGADGTWRQMQTVASNLFHDPVIAGLVLTSRDITSEELAELRWRAADRRFRQMIEASHDGVWALHPAGDTLFANERMAQMLGVDLDRLHSASIFEFLDADGAVAFQTGSERWRAGTSEQLEWRFLRTDGTDVHALVSMSPLHDEYGEHIGVFGMVTDITERKKAERTLSESEQLFRASFAHASVGFWIARTDGYFHQVNRALADLLGYTEAELLTRSVEEVTHPDDRDSTVEHTAALVAGTVEAYNLEQRYLRADGEVVYVRLSASAITDGDGRCRYVVAVVQDLTGQRQAQAELTRIALQDPVTGLPNRTLLVDRLDLALRRAQRTRRCLAVLFLDIDQFKVVNDSLGHAAGDELLRHIAERLASTLRLSDTVARFGGDEFVVLCEEVGDEASAERLAERLQAALALPCQLGEDEVRVSASIGIALARDGDADGLLRDADAAMYRAKRSGRARHVVFNEDLRLAQSHRLRLSGELRLAVEQDQLELHYQPVVALDTGIPVGVEALVRWRHPVHGLLHPGEFIPLAEESGLIGLLGDWVLERACRQAARWRRGTGPAAGLYVAVNLSAHQFAPELAERVADLLVETGLPASALMLEVTESAVMADAATAADVLESVGSLGVQVALDDFGTGYSSLAYLKRLPFTELKIDRSFVDGLGVEGDDRSIVTAVVGLAAAVGVHTTAEGVETPAQLAELRRLGCDSAQGFLWSPAVPAHELDGVLEAISNGLARECHEQAV